MTQQHGHGAVQLTVYVWALKAWIFSVGDRISVGLDLLCQTPILLSSTRYGKPAEIKCLGSGIMGQRLDCIFCFW